MQTERGKLIELLRLAHAGERAAAFAYAGHWRSVRDPDERAAIRAIEDEEWAHRRCLAGMLAGLGSRPALVREPIMATIGRLLGLGCFVSGWFLPMYGAGWIERRNVWENVTAARYAAAAGEDSLVEPLLRMAEVEWDHEQYFRTRVRASWQVRRLRIPLWRGLPPRDELRSGFIPLKAAS
ncbi:MAG: ferritin-like domain-containing protein [Planctomycetes bacterium]|nr:ferritin-like domain-containing protein [Planctomycetota bacterium]